MNKSVLIFTLAICFSGALSLPEQGLWNVHLTQSKSITYFAKTMFTNSSVYLKIVCQSKDPNLRVVVNWLLRYSPCADEFIQVNDRLATQYLIQPAVDFFGSQYKQAEYKEYRRSNSFLCDNTPFHLQTSSEDTKVHSKKFQRNNTTGRRTNVNSTSHQMHKRAAGKSVPLSAQTTTHTSKDKDEFAMFKTATTWADGAYLLVLKIETERSSKKTQGLPQFDADVTVWMKSSYGYLSALEWPFLIFYGVMCLVYLVYAIVWTILSACHWRDILRVQFWIGAVILLGMLEKAMFYAEYQSINSTGRSVRGAVIFAEFVSCIKRTLARLLVMVVSIGYGIVKPRLGPALVKVVVIGIAYFVFALIEGCIRVLRPRFDIPRIILLVQVPLALTDAIILWWTFTYLVQTIQQMRLRRNIVKFNLYKHFSNILILVVGVSVVFMGWSVFYHKWFICKKHWREIWVDDAFWHILFSVILLVIIWLWRPSRNNQRYAYSPVLDADDDADEDVIMDNLTTGELIKKTSHNENGTTKRDSATKAEDDLRWVEEHIPSSSAAENVFPLVDSDEEIATTKLHLNKME